VLPPIDIIPIISMIRATIKMRSPNGIAIIGCLSLAVPHPRIEIMTINTPTISNTFDITAAASYSPLRFGPQSEVYTELP
jgi:hypothetical protein